MKNPGLAPLFLAATLFHVPARGAQADFPRVPEAFRARLLEMFDANKDGRLDEAERARAQKFLTERGLGTDGPMRGELLKRFDKNGNGKLDEEERAALMDFLRQRTPPAPTSAEPPPPAVEFEKPAPERIALERLIRAAVAADPEQLKRFDADKDGKLNDAEWSVARMEIQHTFNDGAVLRSMSGDDERRMKAIGAEVARRREEKEPRK